MSWKGWEEYTPGASGASVVRRGVRKYRNVPTFVLVDLRLCEADSGPVPAGACKFASRKEAERYVELALQQRDGKISGLELQPRYPLHVIDPSGVKHDIGAYVGDLAYVREGQVVVEDVKSEATKTPLYRWKKRHVQSEYGLEIQEV